MQIPYHYQQTNNKFIMYVPNKINDDPQFRSINSIVNLLTDEQTFGNPVPYPQATQTRAKYFP